MSIEWLSSIHTVILQKTGSTVRNSMGGLDKAVRDKLLDITDSSMRRSVAQTRKLLMGVALSLSLLMTVMRIPVLLANAA
ncbi:MAG: hypothetical protein ACXAEN_26700 [Candidatus Thorarchaeota archaeon]